MVDGKEKSTGADESGDGVQEVDEDVLERVRQQLASDADANVRIIVKGQESLKHFVAVELDQQAQER